MPVAGLALRDEALTEALSRGHAWSASKLKAAAPGSARKLVFEPRRP